MHERGVSETQDAVTESRAFGVIAVHHTDADREWAYDGKSSIGRLDKGIDETGARGWTVVDMKADWTRVFAFRP